MFIAVAKQSGGCDYTIECGTKVIELKAKNKEQAINELVYMFFNEDGDMHGHDEDVEEIEILEVKDRFPFDLTGIIRAKEEDKKKKEAEEEEKREKAELRRLKAKFGDK